MVPSICPGENPMRSSRTSKDKRSPHGKGAGAGLDGRVLRAGGCGFAIGNIRLKPDATCDAATIPP